jgi:NADPH:quinone reductase-like Zn-dependent oxidoreductase
LEAAVTLEVAASNPSLTLTRSRSAGGADTFPTILGYDGAGRREDTSERVLVTNTPATYAELVEAKEENTFTTPNSLETAAAAAMGVPYKTAWRALVDMGGLKEGDTLLVQGASTATGQASVDIGRLLGAKVHATARADKLDKVRALGAEALEYGDPKVRELDANVVFDPIGADTLSDSVEALAPEGALVTPVCHPKAYLEVRPVVQARVRWMVVAADVSADRPPLLAGHSPCRAAMAGGSRIRGPRPGRRRGRRGRGGKSSLCPLRRSC